MLWERGEDFELCFADTGAELPEVYWLLPRLARLINKSLNVVCNGTFYQHLTNKGFFLPSQMRRWCTQELKRRPQDIFYKSQNGEEVCIGFRADEDRELQQVKEYQYVYPLREAGMNEKEVKQLCQKYDLLNPCYSWRSRVNCFCCFNQRNSDWRGLLRNHPTLYALAEEWEHQSFLASPNGYGWNERFTLEAFRKAKEDQYQLWPDPEGELCLICSI